MNNCYKSEIAASQKSLKELIFLTFQPFSYLRSSPNTFKRLFFRLHFKNRLAKEAETHLAPPSWLRNCVTAT